MNKTAQGNILIALILVFVVALVALILYKNSSKSLHPLPQNAQTTNPSTSKTKEYTSNSLKILFKYPKDWFVEEKDRSIMITNYPTKIGENKQPDENQLKLFLDEFSGCFESIEENLIDPACGEGGQTAPKNKILSKEMHQAKGGTFYKYVINTPKGNQFIYYLLENGKNVLKIEKHPDPSQYEKEFEEIINSIEFL